MSTNNTQNLELHAWEPFDAFTREEFNDNFEKLDAAVKSDRAGIAAAQSKADEAYGEALVAHSAADVAQATADALSKTYEANKTGTDAAIAAINANLGRGGANCRFATGEYTGNGKAGKNNPVTLTFDFKPYFAFVTMPNDSVHEDFFIRGITTQKYLNYTLYVDWTDNSVSYYTGDAALNFSAELQLNALDRKFYYIAFGF